jgi:hypothetical protein
LFALVVTHGTRARIPEIGKVVVAFVAVGPANVYAFAGGKVNLQANRFFSGIEWYGHLDATEIEGSSVFSIVPHLEGVVFFTLSRKPELFLGRSGRGLR